MPTTTELLFSNGDSPDAWTVLYNINSFSNYYMTSAFLAKGSRDAEDYTSSIVNITSISGILKILQRQVSTSISISPWLTNIDPRRLHVFRI